MPQRRNGEVGSLAMTLNILWNDAHEKNLACSVVGDVLPIGEMLKEFVLS
jgi:hypothetical protein